jgi:phosphate transport system protein
VPTENDSKRRHIVRSFDEELKLLIQRLAEMGGMAEQNVGDSIKALMSRDVELAKEVRSRDDKIDAMEEEIDQFAIRMLATRQPMAVDLRSISMSLKISNDIERIGDYASSIAKRAIRLAEQPSIKPLVTIPRMAQACQGMVKDVLDAMVERNTDRAMNVWQRDELVDQYYDGIFRELLTYILEDPRQTSLCVDLMFVAKNLERIGDHATNIAERVHYVIHGEQINRQR